MTAPTLEFTLTLEEVMALDANDTACMAGIKTTVADSGAVLDSYYQHHERYNFRGGVKGHFWTKVNEVAEILKGSNEWPFQPLTVNGERLLDGHHRANAAIVAGWEKPIPVTDCWMENSYDSYGSDGSW